MPLATVRNTADRENTSKIHSDNAVILSKAPIRWLTKEEEDQH